MANCLVDSMSSSLFNVKNYIDDTIRSIDQVSMSIQKELIESMEMYEKNYVAQNKALIKRGVDIFGKMNLERNNLLGAKEDYLNMMNNLTLVKRKREEREQKRREKRDRTSSDASASSITNTSNNPNVSRDSGKDSDDPAKSGIIKNPYDSL